ncbi:MAG: MBL fold metallo-hydrolase [Chloroflexi bacterium]|nr:MBL fold metallo-hydrolase [Chloroflexota bacterium]
MKLQWMGHATFLVTAEDGTKIVTDPYEPGYKNRVNYGPVPDVVDVVTVSHEHGDHNFVGALNGTPQVIKGYGYHAAKSIVFMGLPTYHDRVKGRERGTNIVFSFTVDGINVCHLGDLGHPLSDSQTAELGQVDVLLIATGGPTATCELDVAHDVCQRIYPRIVVPMHFKTDKCTFPKYRAQDFIAGKSNARVINDSEIEIKKSDLPGGMEIVVLKAAL